MGKKLKNKKVDQVPLSQKTCPNPLTIRDKTWPKGTAYATNQIEEWGVVLMTFTSYELKYTWQRLFDSEDLEQLDGSPFSVEP